MAVTYEDIFDRYFETEIDQVTLDLTFNLYTSGLLQQYHWYKITKVGSLTDFTSVGSPNNTVGTRFQANTALVAPTWDGGELQTGKTVIEFITEYIDNARVDLAGFAEQAQSSVDETNVFQKEFLVCYSMALMCENVGLTDKALKLKNDGLKALYSLWGSLVFDGNGSDTNQLPLVRPVYAKITKCDYSEFDASMGF
jgi:hypothetical protein